MVLVNHAMEILQHQLVTRQKIDAFVVQLVFRLKDVQVMRFAAIKVVCVGLIQVVKETRIMPIVTQLTAYVHQIHASLLNAP